MLLILLIDKWEIQSRKQCAPKIWLRQQYDNSGSCVRCFWGEAWLLVAASECYKQCKNYGIWNVQKEHNYVKCITHIPCVCLCLFVCACVCAYVRTVRVYLCVWVCVYVETCGRAGLNVQYIPECVIVLNPSIIGLNFSLSSLAIFSMIPSTARPSSWDTASPMVLYLVLKCTRWSSAGNLGNWSTMNGEVNHFLVKIVLWYFDRAQNISHLHFAIDGVFGALILTLSPVEMELSESEFNAQVPTGHVWDFTNGYRVPFNLG